VFSANAVILAISIGLIALFPVIASSRRPTTSSELLVLAGGLIVMLAVNLLLMRRILTPLRRLRRVMSEVDPSLLKQPVNVGARSVEVAALTAAFNGMLARLKEERSQSTRRTQAAQERERRALSLELHDEIGQNLTALLLQLDVASRSASGDQLRALENSIATVRECLEQVRAIVRRLRPEALDDLGLASAVEHLCDRVGHDSGLMIERSVDPALPRLSSDAQLVVYRVAQESLTNVVRHSGARCATVTLRPHPDGIRLTVTDDGVGAPPAREEGSGIRGMRERALMIGATLDIKQRAPSGIEVVLDVPSHELQQ
jgi:two-component system sensor histidine kinase UhpB